VLRRAPVPGMRQRSSSCGGVMGRKPRIREDSMALIEGNARDNVLVGMEFRDRIFGKDGDDVLRGLAGNDLLDGGDGHDTLIGDNSHLITPHVVVYTGADEAFQFFIHGVQLASADGDSSTLKLNVLEPAPRDRTVQVPDKPGSSKLVDRVEHHLDAMASGAVKRLAGDGDDRVIGDANILRAALATIQVGASPTGRPTKYWQDLGKAVDDLFQSLDGGTGTNVLERGSSQKSDLVTAVRALLPNASGAFVQVGPTADALRSQHHRR